MLMNSINLVRASGVDRKVLDIHEVLKDALCENRASQIVQFRLLGLLAYFCLTFAAIAQGHNFYVSPNGSADGDGSIIRPWDLATALQDNTKTSSKNNSIKAGDTIWLRGGTYTGTFTSILKGAHGNPIWFKQYPNELAIIDQNLSSGVGFTIIGWSANYQGFTVCDSSTNRIVTGAGGIYVFGTNVNLINLVIHDCRGDGITAGLDAIDCGIYGCIIYNNGYQNVAPDRGHGHGLYLQGPYGTKKAYGNIVFNQFGYGLHAYMENQTVLCGMDIQNNIFFRNGIISRGNVLMPNFWIGALNPTENAIAISNRTYHPPKTTTIDDVQFGHGIVPNKNLIVANNFFAGGGLLCRYWSNGVVTNNVFILGANVQVKNGLVNNDPYVWNRNKYYFPFARPKPFYFWATNNWNFADWKLGTSYDANSISTDSMITGTNIFIVKDPYETNRGFVTIYNWNHKDVINVDVSGVLALNTSFQVLNVQDLFGIPVLSGVYSGGLVSLPMTNSPVAAPVGVPTPPPIGPEFNVFLVKEHPRLQPPKNVQAIGSEAL